MCFVMRSIRFYHTGRSISYLAVSFLLIFGVFSWIKDLFRFASVSVFHQLALDKQALLKMKPRQERSASSSAELKFFKSLMAAKAMKSKQHQ